jgi:hypothetical protein
VRTLVGLDLGRIGIDMGQGVPKRSTPFLVLPGTLCMPHGYIAAGALDIYWAGLDLTATTGRLVLVVARWYLQAEWSCHAHHAFYTSATYVDYLTSAYEDCVFWLVLVVLWSPSSTRCMPGW